MRIVIIGGPRTGKTTTAAYISVQGGGEVKHTDDLMHLGWSGASLEASFWFDQPGPWIVEGVAAVRGLRKWLARHEGGKPCDQIIVRDHAWELLTPGQERMAKGHETIWRGIDLDLDARGVEIA